MLIGVVLQSILLDPDYSPKLDITLGNLMFDKRQLKEAYKILKTGPDWTRLDQIGSDWIR